MTSSISIAPVVLAGGIGTRLWPLSRRERPKQFLPLAGDTESLMQETLKRSPAAFKTAMIEPIVVCNEEHRFLVAEQLRAIGIRPGALVLEPFQRNTAPALTAAACIATRTGLDPILLVMPSDHQILEHARFAAALDSAIETAITGEVVAYGVPPLRADSDYGYIELGRQLKNQQAYGYELSSFHEKPSQAAAESFIKSGKYLWNSGIFVLRASRWLELIKSYNPAIYEAAGAAAGKSIVDKDFVRLQADEFRKCPSDSIDYAVMEPLARDRSGAVVICLEAGWSDLGSWAGGWAAAEKDADNNCIRGDGIAIRSENNLIFADHRLVAMLGCQGLCVVETADAVLVADLKYVNEMTKLNERLTAPERDQRLP